MKEIGYCKDCKHRGRCANPNIPDENFCLHPKLGELAETKNNDYLLYPYDEGGSLITGDYFGCIHWEPK